VAELEIWRAEDAAAGARLDRYLADRLEVPRNQTARWIREGAVTVDGARVKPSRLLEGGERIECEPLSVQQPSDLEPEPGELRVLHQDDEIVVLDKPAGLVVHPGAGNLSGTLVHRLLARFPEMAAVGGPGRPGIVHRLDRDTSGVLVVARTPRAYRRLSEDFAERRVEKIYLALCYGSFDRASDRPPPDPAQGDGGGRRRPARADPLPDPGTNRGREPARDRARDRAHAPDPGAPQGGPPPFGWRPGLR
jgi:23S rRNA pseudouridine1911/1915/1917 synthase